MKAGCFRLVVLALLFVPQICWPEPASHEAVVPSKDAVKQTLLAFWEKTVKADPGTKLFERTADPGVYHIQTTLLPYDGRVKVLNLFVDDYKPGRQYDKHVAYGGIVETELMDAPKDMAINQPFSFNKWQRMGWFDYDGATAEWFPFNDWDKHFPPEKRARGDAPRQRQAGPGT